MIHVAISHIIEIAAVAAAASVSRGISGRRHRATSHSPTLPKKCVAVFHNADKEDILSVTHYRCFNC